MAITDRDARIDFLGGVPILAGLSAELRSQIAARSSWVQLPAGAWLFRQGEPGDSLYIVRSGRLEIVVEEPEEVVVRVLGRGAAVGELALLTASARSASARARRDSELLELTRAHFTELLAEQPEFALALTRELGQQLQASRALASADSPVPAVISLVPLSDGIAPEDLTTGIAGRLRAWGTVLVLDERGGDVDASRHAELLDRAERENDWVLLVGSAPAEEDLWTDFCLRQSDRVLGLAGDARPPEWLTRYPQLAGCDLVIDRGRSASIELDAWLGLRPRATHVLPAGTGFDACVTRLARRLAGRSLGVVLSGGGARGFAHIGVLEELVGAGLEIDRVGGCSMGAYVGGMFAMETEIGDVRARCREEFVRRNPLNDYTVPLVSLLRGGKAREMLIRTFGEEKTIGELSLDYFCVSCDLVSGDLVVHRQGLMFEAVGASMSLPGVFAPLARNGHLLVDGGVLNNLPVLPMAAAAEGPVIAVDVTARFLPPEAPDRRMRRPGTKQWISRARRTLVGADTPLPSFKETLTRSIGIGSVDAVEVARRRADLLITPETGSVPMLDFGQLDRMVEIGRRATRAALADAPPAVIAGGPREPNA